MYVPVLSVYGRCNWTSFDDKSLKTSHSGGNCQQLAIRTPGNTKDSLTNGQIHRLSRNVLDLSSSQVQHLGAATSRHNCMPKQHRPFTPVKPSPGHCMLTVAQGLSQQPTHALNMECSMFLATSANKQVKDANQPLPCRGWQHFTVATCVISLLHVGVLQLLQRPSVIRGLSRKSLSSIQNSM